MAAARRAVVLQVYSKCVAADAVDRRCPSDSCMDAIRLHTQISNRGAREANAQLGVFECKPSGETALPFFSTDSMLKLNDRALPSSLPLPLTLPSVVGFMATEMVTMARSSLLPSLARYVKLSVPLKLAVGRVGERAVAVEAQRRRWLVLLTRIAGERWRCPRRCRCRARPGRRSSGCLSSSTM